MTDFHLVDLVSQRQAVRQYLRGCSKAEIIAWLSTKGSLEVRNIQDTEVFDFTSGVGIEDSFFFQQDDFVFIGDHCTFT
ncbi:MAG: hypothetical protein AAGA67_12340 [Cyanobacteria bacterium P01_F01_bin.153]